MKNHRLVNLILPLGLILISILTADIASAHGTDHIIEEFGTPAEDGTAVDGETNASVNGETITESPPTRSIFEVDKKLLDHWTFDPATIVILIMMLLYANSLRKLTPKLRKARRKKVWMFYIGCFWLLLALDSPVDAYADFSFLAHMIQHLFIIIFGSLFVVLGDPVPYMTKGLPDGIKRSLVVPLFRNKMFRSLLSFFTNPIVAGFMYVMNMWAWHYPLLYHYALTIETVHYLQHFLFFITSLNLWLIMFPPAGQGRVKGMFRALYMLVPMIFDSLLGAVISLQSKPIYSFPDVNLWGLSNFEHQLLGGMFMWVVGGFFYLVVLGMIFWDSYHKSLEDSQTTAPA